jgi:hypothetical protein
MSGDDVVQIRMGEFSVGIIGLTHVMEEMAHGYMDASDEVVEQELLVRLAGKNYIPDNARERYGRAFLREFRRFLGRPVEEDAPAGLEVKILGMGCSACDGLEREVIEAMAEIGIPGDVEHVRDIKAIGRYGVMGSPALIVNGKVKWVGSAPPRRKIIEWLKEAKKSGVLG